MDRIPSSSKISISTPLRRPMDDFQDPELGERSPLLRSGAPSEASTDEDEEDDEDLDDGLSGAVKSELVQAVWGKKARWLLFSGIALSAYIYSLDSTTTYQYLYYATSTVLKHSMSGTIATVQAIIIAVGKPFMAKLADVMGRAEALVAVTILYVIGYVVIASANSVEGIAVGEIFYAFGFTGLQILQQIVIADMTTLRYRGLVSALVSAPFIINNFVAAEILERVLPNWRLGYAMFAVLLPICLSPLILALLWGQHHARKIAFPLRSHRRKRNYFAIISKAFSDMDILGLSMLAVSMSLILLPLGLAPEALHGWEDPKMPAMIILGLVFFPLFMLYEAKVPSKPVMPIKWLRRPPIFGACLIGFADFASFYFQQTYLYSFMLVIEPDWSYRYLTYFSAIQSLTMTVAGIIAGTLMWYTRRFKYMLFSGLIIRLIGVTLMIKARSSTGTTLELILCQILQGIGGGFAAIAIHVSAQAAVSHSDVATVIAMVLLISEMGNSVGSAAATAIWNANMPGELRRFVPTDNETLLEDLFGSITDIAGYAKDDPIRIGAILAYQAVMYKLVIAAVLVAILPPIFCLLLIKNVQLTRAQNAVDNRDLTGSETDEAGDDDERRLSWDNEEGTLRLSRSTSRLTGGPMTPARRATMSGLTPHSAFTAQSDRTGLSGGTGRRSTSRLRRASITSIGGRLSLMNALREDERGERLRLTPSKKALRQMKEESDMLAPSPERLRPTSGRREDREGRGSRGMRGLEEVFEPSGSEDDIER